MIIPECVIGTADSKSNWLVRLWNQFSWWGKHLKKWNRIEILDFIVFNKVGIVYETSVSFFHT